MLTCTVIQLRISISLISTESRSTCSPMHQEHSAMADGGKGPPSTSAMLPSTITDDAPPTRSHTSLSGTTATSSPAGDASAGATGSAHETFKTATNTRKHHECANCGERAADRCGAVLKVSTAMVIHHRLTTAARHVSKVTGRPTRVYASLLSIADNSSGSELS